MKSMVPSRIMLAALVPLCLTLASCSQSNQPGGQPSLSSLVDQTKTALDNEEKQYGKAAPQIADDLIKLGDLCRTEGKLAESDSLLKRAVEIRKAQTGGSPLAVAKAMNDYGLTLVAEGFFKQAETVLHDALSLRETNHAEPAAIAESQNSLGQLYYEGGVLAEAKNWFQKSFDTIKSTAGSNSPEFAEAQNNLAGICFAEGKLEEAEQMFQSSMNIYQNAYGNSRPEVADCKNNLGEVYRAQGKYPQAESAYKDAISIYQGLSLTQHPKLASCLNNLGLLYAKQKLYDKAEPLYKQALGVEEACNEASKTDLSNTLSNYAALLHETKRETEAKAMESRLNTLIASQQ